MGGRGAPRKPEKEQPAERVMKESKGRVREDRENMIAAGEEIKAGGRGGATPSAERRSRMELEISKRTFLLVISPPLVVSSTWPSARMQIP